VQLSPKYVFFGIVALGLPLAVAVGWALGTPPTVPAEASVAPGAAAAMGTAPQRTESTQSGEAGGSSSRQRPASDPSASPITLPPPVRTAPRPAATAPTATAVPRSAPPTLTAPPVPTPTDVGLDPSDPSDPLATPEDGPPWYHHGGGAWWVRRQ
jgi:hypothetical protein